MLLKKWVCFVCPQPWNSTFFSSHDISCVCGLCLSPTWAVTSAQPPPPWFRSQAPVVTLEPRRVEEQVHAEPKRVTDSWGPRGLLCACLSSCAHDWLLKTRAGALPWSSTSRVSSSFGQFLLESHSTGGSGNLVPACLSWHRG